MPIKDGIVAITSGRGPQKYSHTNTMVTMFFVEGNRKNQVFRQFYNEALFAM